MTPTTKNPKKKEGTAHIVAEKGRYKCDTGGEERLRKGVDLHEDLTTRIEKLTQAPRRKA